MCRLLSSHAPSVGVGGASSGSEVACSEEEGATPSAPNTNQNHPTADGNLEELEDIFITAEDFEVNVARERERGRKGGREGEVIEQ